MQNTQSWGRLTSSPHHVIPLYDVTQVSKQLQNSTPGIPFGMGRSYGDVCLNPQGPLWSTRGLDRLIHFDPEQGRLICEAGVLLKEIQTLMLPRGWALPVTPGTLSVTVGGAIANDVHGKNQAHFGTFGDHVRWIRLMRTNGEVIECGPDLNRDWFTATVGGLGLTGLIIEVALQLRRVPSKWLETQTSTFETLDEFFILAHHASNWEYTVAWLDCTRQGKGLFKQAKWSHDIPPSALSSKSLHLPPFPISLINRWTLKPLNILYTYLNRPGRGLMPYEQFLYPLDACQNWNRLYGPRGFYQYQVLLNEEAALKEMLVEIVKASQGSCLAVLKTFQHRAGPGMMSFVKPGVTLALDFANEGSATLNLLARLEAISSQAGGRVYLAKDASMSAAFFEASYPNLNAFRAYRDVGMSSALSRRLGI